MEYLDILVTHIPEGVDLDDDHAGPVDCERPALIVSRWVENRRFVTDKIEEEMRHGSFVHRHSNGELVEIEIHDERSVSRVVGRVKEIIELHKHSTNRPKPFARVSV